MLRAALPLSTLPRGTTAPLPLEKGSDCNDVAAAAALALINYTSVYMYPRAMVLSKRRRHTYTHRGHKKKARREKSVAGKKKTSARERGKRTMNVRGRVKS